MTLFYKHIKNKNWNIWCNWRGFYDSLLPRLYINRIDGSIKEVIYFTWYKLEFYIATKYAK